MFKKIIAIVLALLTLLSLAGCNNDTARKSEKIKIVTSFFPIFDFTREITKGEVELEMILPLGVEPHSYEPTISNIASIENADLVIYIGGESDKFLEKTNIKNKSLKLSEVVDTYSPDEIGAIMSNEEHEHEHHDDGNFDEHIWLSPKNAIKIVDSILDAIIKIDEKNAQIYKNNAKEYKFKLEKLSNDLNEIPKDKEVIIADRFPFGYLLHDYGFKFSSALPMCSSESEPTIDTMKFLIDTIKKSEIKTVFTIEFSPKTIAKRLQKECGVNIKTLYSMQSISKNDFVKGETYLTFMNKNIELLKEAK